MERLRSSIITLMLSEEGTEWLFIKLGRYILSAITISLLVGIIIGLIVMKFLTG